MVVVVVSVGVYGMAKKNYTYCSLCSEEAKHPAYIKDMVPGRGHIYKGKVCDQCVTKPYVFPDANFKNLDKSVIPTITQLRDFSSAIVSEIEFLIYQLNQASMPRQEKGELMSLIKFPTMKARRKFHMFDGEWKRSKATYPNHLSGEEYLTPFVGLFNDLSAMWWGLQPAFHTIREVIS